MQVVPRVCLLYHSSYEKFVEQCDYEPIIYDFGQILLKVDEDDYQGDSYILYGDLFEKEKFGFLNFGWGSCSGCDALQACYSWEKIQELYNNLKSSVIWFNNATEAYEWFCNHDWEGDYSTIEKRKFIKVARAMLKAIISE